MKQRVDSKSRRSYFHKTKILSQVLNCVQNTRNAKVEFIQFPSNRDTPHGSTAFPTTLDYPLAAATGYQSFTAVRRIFTSWSGLSKKKEP